MLRLFSKRGQTNPGKNISSKDKICTVVNETLRLSGEIGAMGAEQTTFGLAMSERVCYITDQAILNEIGDVGAEQTAMGMGVSQYVKKLDEQLEIIAKEHGCKLVPRP